MSNIVADDKRTMSQPLEVRREVETALRREEHFSKMRASTQYVQLVNVDGVSDKERERM